MLARVKHWTISIANNGQEVLDMLLNQQGIRYDMILMDVQMVKKNKCFFLGKEIYSII